MAQAASMAGVTLNPAVKEGAEQTSCFINTAAQKSNSIDLSESSKKDRAMPRTPSPDSKKQKAAAGFEQELPVSDGAREIPETDGVIAEMEDLPASVKFLPEVAKSSVGLDTQAAKLARVNTPDQRVPPRPRHDSHNFEEHVKSGYSGKTVPAKRSKVQCLKHVLLTAYAVAVLSVLVLGTVWGGLYLLCGHRTVQQYMSSREFSPLISMVGKGYFANNVAINILQRLATGNQENKHALVKFGVVPPLVEIINGQDGVTDAEQLAAARMIHFLCLGAPANSKVVLSSGGIPGLAKLLQKAPESRAGMAATEALAVLMANEDAAFRHALLDVDGVDALINLLTTGPEPFIRGTAAWALANFAGADTATQEAIANSEVVESLIKSLWAGAEELVSQNALLTVGNLVVHNAKNQELVRELNGIEAAIKLLELSTDLRRQNNSDSGISRELVEKILDASKKSHTIRSAIREIGGAQQLIRLALPQEADNFLFINPNRHALVIVNDEEHGNTSKTTMDEVRDLLKLLQEEVDHDQDNQRSFVSRFSSSPEPLHLDARLLETTTVLSREGLADRAAWAIGNMAAGNLETQNLVRKLGGIELLLSLLESVNTNPSGAKSAATALSNLASGNKENRIAIHRHGGIEILIRILGTNTDKDIVASAARVLKIIAHEDLLGRRATVNGIGQWVVGHVRRFVGKDLHLVVAAAALLVAGIMLFQGAQSMAKKVH